MSTFQFLFIAAILILTLIINRGGQLIYKRVFFIVITIIGFVLMIFPNSASRIANIVGIGRGADLVFYMFILFSWLWFSATSVQMRKTDRKITEIIRTMAINHPMKTLK